MWSFWATEFVIAAIGSYYTWLWSQVLYFTKALVFHKSHLLTHYDSCPYFPKDMKWKCKLPEETVTDGMNWPVKGPLIFLTLTELVSLNHWAWFEKPRMAHPILPKTDSSDLQEEPQRTRTQTLITNNSIALHVHDFVWFLLHLYTLPHFDSSQL